MNHEPSPSFERQPPSTFASLFNLNEPTERFMAGWIARVHTNPPRLYRALAMKRAEQHREGKTERLIYEVARFTGKPACYSLITWNIDEVSMRWRDFSSRRQVMQHYQALR
jgi:hypothetical protein